MHQVVRDEVAANPGVLLVVHDWSTLSFGSHPSKRDRKTLTHKTDIGYDMAGLLVVRGDDGSEIAPIDISLSTADGIKSTRQPPPADTCHVDQILESMQYARDLKLGTSLVHVIDREADSLAHWRKWHADGHHALVRADDRNVIWKGTEHTLTEIAAQLKKSGDFRDAGPAKYHGRKTSLHVAETQVVLHRPGYRNEGKKKIAIPGPPLDLRLVVTEVRDSKGRVLARWLLLSNVPQAMADTATLAKWYYFRWRIESFHKLLKGAGYQLEDWLQRNGKRLLNKLMVAIAACVAVWRLQREQTEGAERFKLLLMQLSGRQTKRDKPITTTGLLAGLWVLQSSLGTLARYGPDKLNQLMEKHLPLFVNRD